MRALTATQLLSVWELGASRRAIDRALLLLAVAAEVSPEELAPLTVGQRDAQLLELHERTFGPRLCCLAACPACQAQLECDLSVADLRTGSPPADRLGEPPSSSWSLASGEWEVGFRLPTSRDLAALPPEVGVDEGRRQLFRTCLLSAHRGGVPVAADDLPGNLAEAIAARMAELDPQADLVVSLHCAACAHAWAVPFDIAGFLWREVEAAALRLLHEIYEIATAYGWSERDIAALPAGRRQAYLELIRG